MVWGCDGGWCDGGLEWLGGVMGLGVGVVWCGVGRRWNFLYRVVGKFVSCSFGFCIV